MDNTKMKEFLGIINSKIVDTNSVINKICNDCIKEKENDDEIEMKKLHYDMSFVCMKSWFTRCSDYFKYEFFRILFAETPIDVLIEVYYIYYSYCMKDSIYAAYCHKPLIVRCQNNISDKNPYLDAKSLNRVIMYDFVWYKNLDSSGKYKLIIDLLQLCDDPLKIEVIKKIIEVLTIYEDSKPKPVEEPPQTGKKGKKGKKEKKKKKKEKKSKKKKGKKGKKEAEPEPEPEPERDIQKEYEEWLQKKFKTSPSLERLNNDVNQAQKRWDDAILRYRMALGENIEDGKGEKKKKKKPKKPKGKKAGQVLDQIQMLPIWVNKRIVADVDAKTKKKIKVNKYLKYLTKTVGQDQKCRTALNKKLNKLEVDTTEEESEETFNFTLRRKFPKKHFDDIPIIKKKVTKPTYHNNTILGDVLQDKKTFDFPIDLKESFRRRI